MALPSNWIEPIVRVQTVSDTGSPVIPSQYIKHPSERSCLNKQSADSPNNIPVIDLYELINGDSTSQKAMMDKIFMACQEWGFFQIVNHGISHELLDKARGVWREFFHQPMEVKQDYANTPKTYEGYGSRVGYQKGATLDWCDYFFLYYLPAKLKNHKKWPSQPPFLRSVIEEYSNEIVKLGKTLLKVLSINLGLCEDYLQDAFGGDCDDIEASLRVNFYPKCPQPDLTLGLSSHSDPGGMTFVLQDDHVSGLQIRKAGEWVTVKPTPHGIVVNIGDQIQVLSNGIYKSVEHRAVVNTDKERVSLAYFFSPKGDKLIKPAPELVTSAKPALYEAMTFSEYRLFIRTKGLQGKTQVKSS